MNSNQIKYFLEYNRLTILGSCIIILALFLTVIILFYPINYTKFSCTRYSENDVVCQKKERIVYGLFSHSTINFPLRGVNIRKNNKYLCLENHSESVSYTLSYNDCIYVYKLYLQGEERSFFIEQKTGGGYLQSERQTLELITQKQQEIEDFINGVGEPLYEYEKVGRYYWVILIIIFLSGVCLWYVNKAHSQAESVATENIK